MPRPAWPARAGRSAGPGSASPKSVTIGQMASGLGRQRAGRDASEDAGLARRGERVAGVPGRATMRLDGANAWFGDTSIPLA